MEKTVLSEAKVDRRYLNYWLFVFDPYKFKNEAGKKEWSQVRELKGLERYKVAERYFVDFFTK